MRIEIRVSDYSHDGDNWTENGSRVSIVEREIPADLPNRAFGRVLGGAIREILGPGFRSREPLGGLSEYTSTVFWGTCLGVYWYPVDDCD